MNCNKECAFNEITRKITDNRIRAEGASKVSESLKINTTLTQLDLHCN